jgi:hypothetical protein
MRKMILLAVASFVWKRVRSWRSSGKRQQGQQAQRAR